MNRSELEESVLKAETLGEVRELAGEAWTRLQDRVRALPVSEDEQRALLRASRLYSLAQSRVALKSRATTFRLYRIHRNGNGYVALIGEPAADGTRTGVMVSPEGELMGRRPVAPGDPELHGRVVWERLNPAVQHSILTALG